MMVKDYRGKNGERPIWKFHADLVSQITESEARGYRFDRKWSTACATRSSRVAYQSADYPLGSHDRHYWPSRHRHFGLPAHATRQNSFTCTLVALMT